MTDLRHDLHERWRPSPEQIEVAETLLRNGELKERAGWPLNRRDAEPGVYTTHLLVNKDYGFWTADVLVVTLDGVFLTREAALDFVKMVARKRHDESGERVTGGYTWHSEPGCWAVFEDICSQFPER